MSNYNEYGVYISKPKPNIIAGNKVEYIDSYRDKEHKSCKYPLIGIWDGEKVEFHDKKDTIVRTVWWLAKAENPKFFETLIDYLRIINKRIYENFK